METGLSHYPSFPHHRCNLYIVIYTCRISYTSAEEMADKLKRKVRSLSLMAEEKVDRVHLALYEAHMGRQGFPSREAVANIVCRGALKLHERQGRLSVCHTSRRISFALMGWSK